MGLVFVDHSGIILDYGYECQTRCDIRSAKDLNAKLSLSNRSHTYLARPHVGLRIFLENKLTNKDGKMRT